MWATGWRRIDSSWTPTRQNFSGPVPNRPTVLLLLLAADRHYGSETRLSQPAITFTSSVSPSHLTLASTSTLQTQVYRAFTGFVRFEEFVVRLTLSPQTLVGYTLSSHPVLPAELPCWPGRVIALCTSAERLRYFGDYDWPMSPLRVASSDANHHHHHHHHQFNTHECSMNNKIHEKAHTIIQKKVQKRYKKTDNTT